MLENNTTYRITQTEHKKEKNKTKEAHSNIWKVIGKVIRSNWGVRDFPPFYHLYLVFS